MRESPGSSFVPFLLVVTLAGAAVRFLFAWDNAFFADECGTMVYVARPAGYILTHFESWLTMNWFILMEKGIASVFGESPFAMRFVPLVTGTLIIVLGALVAERLFSRTHAKVAAVLLAANPYLIGYSAYARTYATLTMLALLLFWLFLKWREEPSRWSLNILLGLTCALLTLAHLNGLFVVAWLVIAVVLEFVWSKNRKPFKVGVNKLAIMLILFLLPPGIYYLQLMSDLEGFSSEWGGGLFSSLDYIPDVFEAYFTKAFYGVFVHLQVNASMDQYFTGQEPWIAWVFLALFVAGLLYVGSKNKRALAWMLLWIAIPVFAVSALGYEHNAWGYARFHVFTLPVMLIACAAGAVWLTYRIKSRAGVTVLMLALIGLWIPGTYAEYRRRTDFPFHKVMADLNERGGSIYGATAYDRFSLRPYLEPFVRIEGLKSPKSLRDLVDKEAEKTVFFVHSLEHPPQFHLEESHFVKLTVVALPAERRSARLERLFEAYRESEKALESSHACVECGYLYSSLEELAIIRGDAKAAEEYQRKRIAVPVPERLKNYESEDRML